MAGAPRAFDVGLLLMPIEDSARGTFPRWTEILAAARRAEDVGFDAVWIPDHLIMDIHRPGCRPEGAWEGWSLISALAASTSRIGLGLLVSCTAFRNPALLAKMAATVD
ncbi:MAG TPA: LLM class flavin-dependent oxidoreductase, partial [Thermomicrobiales bacterium]|nr:LLM class flavin-dependent oxidoreductase [Thermomicrobiales bacterium]